MVQESPVADGACAAGSAPGAGREAACSLILWGRCKRSPVTHRSWQWEFSCFEISSLNAESAETVAARIKEISPDHVQTGIFRGFITWAEMIKSRRLGEQW